MLESNGPITVCVPVFDAAAFLAETLESVTQQTHENLRIRISVDVSADGSADLCRRFLVDERVEVVEQESRLGWVDNCNFLISRVETPYFFILPHDDILERTYVERVVRTAHVYPKASAIYTDIRCFGLGKNIIAQLPIDGTPITRAVTLLVDHFKAVAFRGLVRTVTANNGCLLQHNPFGDYAEDTVWMMKLAMQGALIRIPELLYRKRLRNGGVHRAWKNRSPDEKTRTWTHHCLELAEIAFDADLPVEQQSLLLPALVQRLLRNNAVGAFAEINALPKDQKQRMLTTFLSNLSHRIGEERLSNLIEQTSIPDQSKGF